MMSEEQINAEFQASIKEYVQKLRNLKSVGWHIKTLKRPTGIALFKSKKNGQSAKYPAVSMYFCHHHEAAIWAIKVGSIERSFISAKAALAVLIELAESLKTDNQQQAITKLEYLIRQHRNELEKKPDFFNVDLTLLIDYVDRDQKKSKRKVKVKGVQYYHSSYYMRGFCHSAKEQRNFKVDRASECVDTITGEVVNNLLELLIDKDLKTPYTGTKKWFSYQSDDDEENEDIQEITEPSKFNNFMYWSFGCVLFINGLLNASLLFILASFFIIPLIRKYCYSVTKISISSKIRVFLVLILVSFASIHIAQMANI